MVPPCGETQLIIAEQKHLEFMIFYIDLVALNVGGREIYTLNVGGALQLVNHKFGPFNCILKNGLNYILSNTVTGSHNLTLLICQASYGNT